MVANDGRFGFGLRFPHTTDRRPHPPADPFLAYLPSLYSTLSVVRARSSSLDEDEPARRTLTKLESASLKGVLPPEWSALTEVTRMQLFNNEISGPLPPEWSAMTKVTSMNLQNNKISGPLPP